MADFERRLEKPGGSPREVIGDTRDGGISLIGPNSFHNSQNFFTVSVRTGINISGSGYRASQEKATFCIILSVSLTELSGCLS
jgi:hypothetical protein